MTGFFALAVTFAIKITAYEFSEKSENTGIIFTKTSRARVSYNSFTLVYHIDLNGYLQMTEMVAKCINELERLCNYLDESNCMLIIDKLRDHLKHMTNDERGINAYRISQRQKRGLINFGGKILHYLFGVIDEDTAMEYKNEVDKIKNKMDREYKVQTDQLLLVRESLTLSNKTYIEIKKLVNETLIRIHDLNQFSLKNTRKLQLDERLLELSDVAQLLISEHERYSGQILKNLENTITGKISNLIPIQALKTDIAGISKHLNENQMLPIDPQNEDVLHIYRFTTVRAALVDATMFIELTLPIVERTLYTLYRTIPVPFKTGDQTIITTSKSRLFILSDDMSEYIPIETDEYTHAIKNRNEELIFNPAQNAHFTNDDSCEMSILLNPIKRAIESACDTHIIPAANYFVAIEPNMLYYIYVDKMVKIKEQCRGKPTTTHIIQSSGYIQLDRNCRINTDKISIRPHLNMQINTTSIIKLAEYSQNITIKTLKEMASEMLAPDAIGDVETNHLIQNTENEYGKLIDQANELLKDRKYDDEFQKVHINHIITGVISTLVAIVISVVAIFIGIKFFLAFKVESI